MSKRRANGEGIFASAKTDAGKADTLPDMMQTAMQSQRMCLAEHRQRSKTSYGPRLRTARSWIR